MMNWPLSPTGVYATEKWVYSGLLQFLAQEDAALAAKMAEQGRIYKTYYLAEADPYAFNSPQEIDAYLAETAAEFLAAMEKGETDSYIQARTERQAQAEAQGREIAKHWDKP